jgi:hypothetical protein
MNSYLNTHNEKQNGFVLKVQLKEIRMKYGMF